MEKIPDSGLYDSLQKKNTPDLKQNTKLIALKKGDELYSTSQPFTDIYEIYNGAVKLGGLSVYLNTPDLLPGTNPFAANSGECFLQMGRMRDPGERKN